MVGHQRLVKELGKLDVRHIRKVNDVFREILYD